MIEPASPSAWGFIGLGGQGGPMARRMISAGLNTILWARRPEALEPYKDTPSRTAATIPELARQVDYVGLCVVNDSDVQQVCAQLIPEMREGSLIAIHSTVHPDTCMSIERQAAEKGVRVIDAPVSGGGPAADAGELTVMVGGDAADVAAARPALDSFAKLVVHLGPVGAGQQAKLINNTLFAANLGMAHDALLAAETLGISKESLAELIRASSGRSYGFDVRARMPPPPKFRHPAELLAKDVRLLGELMGNQAPGFSPLREAADQFISFVLGAGEG
jgi:3-hydroxyisobutyrate dehydrogenase-like beta-hydroxyacid dehydrogenase